MAALASLPKHRIYECGRCGKKATSERMVFSTHTRTHYCANIDACSRRVKRQAKR